MVELRCKLKPQKPRVFLRTAGVVICCLNFSVPPHSLATMLSRLIPKSSHFRLLSNLYSKSQSYPSSNSNNLTSILKSFRVFSTSGNDDENSSNSSKDRSTDSWNFTRESEGNFDKFFGDNSGNLAGISGTESSAGGDDHVFGGGDKETAEEGVGGDEWMTAEGYKPWSLVEEEKDDVFDIGEVAAAVSETVSEESSTVSLEKSEEAKRLEIEERQLTAVLKGNTGA